MVTHNTLTVAFQVRILALQQTNKRKYVSMVRCASIEIGRHQVKVLCKWKI